MFCTAAHERPEAFQGDRACCGGRENTSFCPCFSLRSALLCRRDKPNTFRNNPIVFTVLNTSVTVCHNESSLGKKMATSRLELPREGSRAPGAGGRPTSGSGWSLARPQHDASARGVHLPRAHAGCPSGRQGESIKRRQSPAGQILPLPKPCKRGMNGSYERADGDKKECYSGSRGVPGQC